MVLSMMKYQKSKMRNELEEALDLVNQDPEQAEFQVAQVRGDLETLIHTLPQN